FFLTTEDSAQQSRNQTLGLGRLPVRWDTTSGAFRRSDLLTTEEDKESNEVIVELKAVDELAPIHEAQLRSCYHSTHRVDPQSRSRGEGSKKWGQKDNRGFF